MKVSRLALALLVLGSGLGLATPAPAAPPTYEIRRESHVVETRHGQIYLEVARPVAGDKDIRAPAIFTYSPYSILYPDTEYGRVSGWDSYVTRGYARVFADVVGTGNSGGCYDYGGRREKETGYDLVEWIAKQKWSTGKVAMTGGSYEGTTAIATAVTDPPHLTTIVPIAAISRWYEYAYSGGIRYFLNNERPADEGIDTPLLFDFGFAIPPPVDVGGPNWAERTQSTITPCEEIEHTQKGYEDTPDYDKFWLERDYIVDADKVDIPVLIGANWGDWNVKQEESVNFYRAVRNSPNAKLFMGNRYRGHGSPSGDWTASRDAWFDHYLMGIENGAETMPDVTSEMSDWEGPIDFYEGAWPNTKPVALVAQYIPPTKEGAYEWQLMPHQPLDIPGLQDPPPASFPSAGINTESHANHHSRTNHDWFWFESSQLSRDVRIFGEIKVQIYSTVDREWVTFTPTVVDVNPAAHTTVAGQHVATDPDQLHSVTRGWLDSRYRKTLRKQTPLKSGKPFEMTVVAKPQDYTFKKGHIIGLNIQTEINEWSVPKPYPCASADCPFIVINWSEGRTRLILPVVDPPKNFGSLFVGGHNHGVGAVR